MLTPVDIENKVFKGGIGYDKKEIDGFMSELSSDYGQLYRSNVEYKDKITTLNESLQHYRSIEDSMQKTLTLSQKTAEETVNAANDKARHITAEAEVKAEAIIADAKVELQEIKDEIYRLQQQHAIYKKQFNRMLKIQLKVLDNEMIDIDLGDDYEPTSAEPIYNNLSGAGFGGGYYPGASFESTRERTNQDPTIDRGPLNMDPFESARTGAGRYGFSSDKSNKSNSDTSKTKLNMKSSSQKNTRVKRDFTTPKHNVSAPVYSSDETTTTSSKIDDTTIVQQEEATKVESILDETATVSGEVETKATDNNMLDSEDNYGNSFDFVSEDANYTETQTTSISDEDAISGEVEEKINETNMLDSEDNYGDGLDFVSEATLEERLEALSNTSEDDTYFGEVEEKINESTMLDSEDNYGDGLDFISEDIAEDTFRYADNEDDIFSGEVEDKINESTMLDSEDNYDDDFNFIVDNDSDDEIPTILSFDFSKNNKEDVLEGDVEDNVKKSNLIDNSDNNDEGFKFL